MSDFKNNGLLPSLCLPPILKDNYRASALVSNTADNIFSEPESTTTIGYIGNYQDIFEFTVSYKYNSKNRIFTKYKEILNSDLPYIVGFNKLYTSSLFDIIIKSNMVYNDNDIVNIRIYQSANNIDKFGNIELKHIEFVKFFTPERITVKYLYDGKFIVTGTKSGLLGYAYNDSRFISSYISFNLRGINLSNQDYISFDISYTYDIDEQYKNSFFVVDIKSIYNLDTVNPDKLLFYTPNARLNNIIPVYESNGSYSLFDNILDNMRQNNINADGINKWGHSKGHILSFPIDNDKFVNYSNYFWIGHLLPTAKMIPNDISICKWVDVSDINLDKSVNDAIIFTKDKWVLSSRPYLLSKCFKFNENRLKVNLVNYDYIVDSNNVVIDSSNIFMFIIVNCEYINIPIVYSYDFADINVVDNIIAVAKKISSGLDIKLFGDISNVDEVYLIFKTLNENSPAYERDYDLSIPQYYCISRFDSDMQMSPCIFNNEDSDWSIDNYWISGNNIFKHSELYNYDPSKAIRAETPIIEFNKNVELNSYYDLNNNLPCDSSYNNAKKYIQRKTVSNQKPLFDIYSINDLYYDADCILYYANSSYIGIQSMISEISFEFPNKNGSMCYKYNNIITPLYSIEIDSTPIYAMAHENNKIEPTTIIPSTNGCWTTPDPLFSDLRRETISNISYDEYYKNAKSLLYSNNNIGNIIQYDVGYDLLLSNHLAKTDMISIIDCARDAYSKLLASPKQFIESFLLKYISKDSSIIVDNNNTIIYDKIYNIFKNVYVHTLFRDKISFNTYSDLVQTLPILNMIKPYKPNIIYDDVLKTTLIQCHDGHCVPYIRLSEDDIKNLINCLVDDSSINDLYSANFPFSIKKNQIWYNTKNSKCYIFNVTSDNSYAGSTPPIDNVYDFWIDISSNNIYKYTNGKWEADNKPGIYYAVNVDNIYKLYEGSNIITLSGKFSGVSEFNVEDIINNIIIDIENEYYEQCITNIDNINYKHIDVDKDYLKTNMKDYFLEYCKQSGLNEGYTGFDAGNSFTWNYKNKLVNGIVGYRWYDLYLKLYNTISPNQYPWKIINLSKKQLIEKCKLLNIELFTYDMWEYIQQFVPYKLSVNFLTNELLPPYMNSVNKNSKYALFTDIPIGIADKIEFGDWGIIEYVWKRSINYQYDNIKCQYQFDPIQFYKLYYGYPIYNKIFNNNIFEYCPYVNEKLPVSKYYQYMDTTDFIQDINVSLVKNNDMIVYYITNIDESSYFIIPTNKQNNNGLLITNNGYKSFNLTDDYEYVISNVYSTKCDIGNEHGYSLLFDKLDMGLFFNNDGHITMEPKHQMDIIEVANYNLFDISEGNCLCIGTDIGNPCIIFDNENIYTNILSSQILSNLDNYNSIDNNISIEFVNDIKINNNNVFTFKLLYNNKLINSGYVDFNKSGNNLIYNNHSKYNICLHIDKPNYYYHTKSTINFNNNDIIFNKAIYYRPIGLIEWVYIYNNAYGIDRNKYTNDIKNWKVDIGFRTTGNVDSNNINLIYNGNNLEDNNYNIISTCVSNIDILRVNSIKINILKIGKSLNGPNKNKYIPLDDGSDWVFSIESSDPISKYITLLDLTDTNEYSIINPYTHDNIEFKLFKSYNKIYTTKNSIIGYGVQSIINIMYGIHLYYESKNVEFIGGSYFMFMMQFINLLYNEGFSVGDSFKINPLNDGISINNKIGMLEKISEYPTESKTYLLDIINEQIPLKNYDIFRNHENTKISAADLCNANLVFNSYDTVITFKNSETLKLVDLSKNVYPTILQTKLTRQPYTGRPIFPGKIIKNDGTLIDNVVSQVINHENAFNIYSDDNEFSTLRYSLYKYNEGLNSLLDIGLTNSDIFRMMKDAHLEQGTVNSIYKIINSNIFGNSYNINEAYMIKRSDVTNTKDSHDIFIIESEVIDVE